MADVTREQALEAALRECVEIVHKAYVAATLESVNAGPGSPVSGKSDMWRVRCLRAEEQARAAIAMPPAQGVEFTRGWEAGPESLGLLAFHLRNMADSMPMDQIDADRIIRAANVIDGLRTPPAPAPWTPPESVNKAVRRVAKIKADLKTFDGDKRGHWAAMDEAMDELYRIIPPLPPTPEARHE